MRVQTKCDAHMWPVGQAVKTAASHAANVGSIPARVTTFLQQFPLDSVVRALYNKIVDFGWRKPVEIVGVDCGEGPPVPIPNTAVKLTCAENTWLETARKDR